MGSYTGKIDYGIGLVRRFPGMYAAKITRPYYSCLIIMEAKRDQEVGLACGQLLGYMACVRAQRQQMNRPDLDIFGIAIDGYRYEFVNIDKLGTVHISHRWDVSTSCEDIRKVLGSIIFIFEKAFDMMAPLLSPNQPGAQAHVLSAEALVDPILVVDATSYY
jgi:hypothetical protein